MGSGSHLWAPCGSCTTVGSSGLDPARNRGVAQPAGAFTGGGAHTFRNAQLLGLAALVGANFRGGCLPALSGHDDGPAVDGFGGRSAIDRDQARCSAGNQAWPGRPGCCGQPAATACRSANPTTDRGQSVRAGSYSTDADVHGASAAG